MLPGNRVVIVGMGAVTPIGNTVDDYWSALLKGHCGIEKITGPGTDGLKSKVWGTVKGLDSEKWFDYRERKRTERASILAYAATLEAVSQCKLPREVYRDTGLLVGSNICALDTIGSAFLVAERRGLNRVRSDLAMRGMPNAHTAVISIKEGFQGGGFAPASACATGANAIGEAFLWVRYGVMPFVIAGGTESAMDPVLFASFANLGALSTKFNDDPRRASRPFDAKRDGFVGSEGAGILILTTPEIARGHGMQPLAEIIGYGTSFDASEMTNPTGEGFALAIKRAIESAEIKPEAVDYVNAHGTSTPAGDKAESEGIKLALGEKHARSIPVSSVKGQIGHTMGGSGAIESTAVIKALQTGEIPPTINQEESDPDCDLDYVPNKSRTTHPQVVLKDSFGFGGNNACLIFKRLDE